MKSTIRFDSSGGYKCKQLNIVSADNGTSVDNQNGTLVLSVNKFAKIDLDTEYANNDYSLKIKSLFMKPILSTATVGTYKATVFVTFGYTHNECGIPAVITLDGIGKDLEIIKNGTNVSIKFNNTVIDTLNNVNGPIRGVRIKPIDEGVDYTDLSNLVIMNIGDIEYTS